MAFVKIMIHAVWGTKSRQPILTKDVRSKVIEHIKANAKTKGIYIDRLNGHVDHMHCLFSLNADISVSKVLQLIKGESSFWINKNGITRTKFEWADEYYASSVSESMVNTVRVYIDNQEQHHQNTTFTQEFEAFLEKNSLESHG